MTPESVLIAITNIACASGIDATIAVEPLESQPGPSGNRPQIVHRAKLILAEMNPLGEMAAHSLVMKSFHGKQLPHVSNCLRCEVLPAEHPEAAAYLIHVYCWE